MANEHPFQHLFETLGRTPTSHAESVNRQAYEALSDILSVPLDKQGRCILLRAPRAGHGKTHLLSRIQHHLGATHEFVPLHASLGCRIDAETVTDDVLRCLVRPLPASGGLTVLDLVTRRLFASALQPLVGSGEVPCQDREGALTALRLRPIETFDFHHPNAVTAHWARENFEVLGQRLSQELSQRGGLQIREVSFWVEALFRFAAAPIDHSNRVSTLLETVHRGSGGEMERLEALLGLVTQLIRVVLVADDLEGFSSDETAALRFAAFLGGLRQSVDRLDVILSLNRDIWESAFVPRLSGGLADRLSEVVVELEPLDEAEMAALLDSRVPGLGGKVLERIDVGKSGTHARGVIRAAGVAWLKATEAGKPAAPVSVQAPAAAAIPAMAAQTPVSPEPVAEEIVEKPPVTEAPDEAIEISWPAPEFSPPPSLEIDLEMPADLTVDPEPAAALHGSSIKESLDSPDHFQPAQEFVPDEPAPQEPALTDPYQPQISPSQISPPPFANVEPPFQPQFTQERAPEPQVESPLQIAPPEPQFVSPLPPEQSFQPTYSAEAGVPDYQESPPQPVPAEPVSQKPSDPLPLPIPPEITNVPTLEPAPEPPPLGPSPPTEVPPPPTLEDTDRVDDLLRQFRERYGRGSL